MQLAYPASHLYSQLTQQQLALKIARHSPCNACPCTGLHPPSGVEVVFDDMSNQPSLGDLGQYGSEDEDDTVTYLDRCACSHPIQKHGADHNELGASEFARRGRVAIKLDDLLQDARRLLDFNYTDKDVASLRQSMGPSQRRSSTVNRSSSERRSQSTSSSSSSSDESAAPPAKKRRVSPTPSVSSEVHLDEDDIDVDNDNSDDEDDAEEENRPLASRAGMGIKAPALRMDRTGVYHSRGGKKKAPGMIANLPQSAPVSLGKFAQAETSNPNGHEQLRIKVEDRMDEAQLKRLANGVTVDSAKSPIVPPEKIEKASWAELRKGVIRVIPVENDKEPRSLILLTGLKTLFQRQLPNMPKEYITRIVYEANSKCLAIVKRGNKVVGGICYRPFPHRGFAEIVFFATTSVDQFKGYGAMLMDHFKNHIRSTYPGMMYFLTYADDLAVGYFEKQGFSKDITLDRSIWAGYIKDYESATIMQCKLLPRVDYLKKAEILALQTNAVIEKIKQISKSHIVYPGLPQFQPGPNQAQSVDPKGVPGLKDSSWLPSMMTKAKSPDYHFMKRVLKDLMGRSYAWAFLKPVNKVEVPDYYEVIKHPMDFETMSHKLETNQYPTLDTFVADATLIFDNCRQYNPEQSAFAKKATKLEGVMKDLLAQEMKKGD